MKSFVYDTLLKEEDICNLENEKKALFEACNKGERVVVFGRRNTGKTSLIKNVVIPYFKQKNKKCFVLFADFFGVKNPEELAQRLELAFETSFSNSFPAKALLTSMAESIKNLRPSIEFDSLTGAPSLKVFLQQKPLPKIEMLFSAIKKISEEHHTLVVFDEFQDISFISQGDAFFRTGLQELSHKVPVLILGSKKHLLAQLFTNPKAPFFNWGKDLEFGEIDYEEYTKYMNERFQPHHLKLEKQPSIFLQDKLDRLPEAINITAAQIISSMTVTKMTFIEEQNILEAIQKVTINRASRFRQSLSHFTINEKNFLKALAENSPVREIMGKNFLTKTKLSPRGASKILHKLLDEAILYEIEKGYQISDPLLKYFLITQGG